MLLEFSCTAGAGWYGVSDCVVVVSLELEEGRITMTGGLATVFVVTVLLLTLGAAGMVETVLSDSVVVWHHALPARPTAIPIEIALEGKVKAEATLAVLDISNSKLLLPDPNAPDVTALLIGEAAAFVAMWNAI